LANTHPTQTPLPILTFSTSISLFSPLIIASIGLLYNIRVKSRGGVPITHQFFVFSYKIDIHINQDDEGLKYFIPQILAVLSIICSFTVTPFKIAEFFAIYKQK
jgi:hypothetical protein